MVPNAKESPNASVIGTGWLIAYQMYVSSPISSAENENCLKDERSSIGLIMRAPMPKVP